MVASGISSHPGIRNIHRCYTIAGPSQALTLVSGTAYIFPSHEVHRVTNITAGKRRALVIEFWGFGDTFYMERVDPFRQIQAMGARRQMKPSQHWWIDEVKPAAELGLSAAVMAASNFVK